MPPRSTGLAGRVADLVRAGRAARDAPKPAPVEPGVRARIERLESMVEALQDQLYRQARRDDERFAALERRVQPQELARALDADARRRGL